ncbi:hypothetical protein FHW67_001969 [Herbaspirillum sp. Sphag1AN]|uniref:hypothetical protein n=1 Tax=unclassified Herbaspirillum TaxID=2624150 RepID=UPI00161CAB11|nr:MULTISPECIES: hypothetical protein [unclassified Herbaspirillum]MBB3212686.1 hypothetical protein [Herbaspirillum sp. Sphag1AN]MBB3245883.1 hypothetical protein [Herbaspirillum sp. Sphag64]
MLPSDDETTIQIAVTPPPLTEQEIRVIARQEIQATGATSGLQPLLEMTPDQAIAISTAIALLWATAWCFKQVVNFLKEKDHEDS